MVLYLQFMLRAMVVQHCGSTNQYLIGLKGLLQEMELILYPDWVTMNLTQDIPGI